MTEICSKCEEIKKLLQSHEVDDPATIEYETLSKIAKILGIKLVW